ncbi:MAG TPA: tRNA uridine-5-carboxymethylaminomethyl(34) synthesis GTPase MnmE [Acidiferrobacteraceae bacterium]|nr:tRNA uridine-5-carboxymethylaminomethyl(34) synthesis GTPase MnmE [Acidiferrobacteraceae bacterium]
MTGHKPIDTIAAVATPPGRGGVAIVRVSGPAVATIAEGVLGKLPKPRYALLAEFFAGDGQPLDQGIALYFPAPRSFTGEDVLELQGHGGPVVMDLILARLVELGARLARPGEFSQRAFLNDKLDLAQAEAVADLIDSGSQAAARSALRSLQGAFSGRAQEVLAALIKLRSFVEAAIDFPEEEIDFLDDPVLTERCNNLKSLIEALLASTEQGCLLRNGMTLALVGRPNVGKSSLMNRLAQRDTAIVSATPGTTRDLLREQIQVDGLPLHIIDTAGLRHSEDEVEAQGVARAWAAMEEADRVLVVIDDDEHNDQAVDDVLAELPQGVPYSIVLNKADLSGREIGIVENNGHQEIALSAKTGDGMDLLVEHLKTCMGYQIPGDSTFIARRRHLDAIGRAHRHIHWAIAQLKDNKAGELMAEELRLAQQALNEITGEYSSDDLLGSIFSSFCVGK